MDRREAVKRIAVGAAAVPVVAEVLGREPYTVIAPPHGVRITTDGRVTTPRVGDIVEIRYSTSALYGTPA